ncbi:MAG: radical SAM protein [Candidatus Omnitrophica bacterium]|nr:radical SAM protein [Candidatus Omnitrophota bacterium]
MITFGPVPSRRLGQSLGINNIPPKVCTYSCTYCQAGRTSELSVQRKKFYEPGRILREVEQRITKAREKAEDIDYLTFAPDGEPTLDENLGREIEALRRFGIKIAVITNSSLLWDKNVREQLSRADWVSIKIDVVSPDTWRTLNRPHPSLDLARVLEGIEDFTDIFEGFLATETMLIGGVNDAQEEVEKTADFTAGLIASKSYISVPTRPPAEGEVSQPDESAVNRAYQIFTERGIVTECLIGYEGNAFAFTGDVKKDILSITSVHPMKQEAVDEVLRKAGASTDVVGEMIAEGKLRKVRYREQDFYVRKI